MFRPYMAIIRFFSLVKFRYINYDVEISHPIIIGWEIFTSQFI